MPLNETRCTSFCRYGCTKITISDQGREFVNKVSESLFERTKTEHRISTAYHPQTNGLVERYNQTLQRSLLKLVNKEQDNWDEFIEEYKLKKPEQSRKLWIPELNLAKSEQDVLLNPTAWLTDTLIDAAQILLKKANPAMSGLQSVVLGQTMNFDIEPGEFVQILHNGHGHWLTISTVGNEHPQVEVYDSAYSCCPTICKAQIAALLSTSQPAIELRFMDVQMQAGGYDCGLFAIAFATAVVLGQHPGLFCFDQRKMRQHFKTCLEQGCITMFPLKKMRRRIKVKTTEPIPVFCHCRMPELTQTTKWIECSNCKEWYHADACVQVEPKYFVLKCKWFCAHCNKI